MIFLYEILCIFKIRTYFNIYAKYADNFQLSSAFATGKSYYVKYSRYTNVAKRINQPHTHMHQDTCDRNIKPEWCIILKQFERLVKKGTRLKYIFFIFFLNHVRVWMFVRICRWVCIYVPMLVSNRNCDLGICFRRRSLYLTLQNGIVWVTTHRNLEYFQLVQMIEFILLNFETF